MCGILTIIVTMEHCLVDSISPADPIICFLPNSMNSKFWRLRLTLFLVQFEATFPQNSVFCSISGLASVLHWALFYCQHYNSCLGSHTLANHLIVFAIMSKMRLPSTWHDVPITQCVCYAGWCCLSVLYNLFHFDRGYSVLHPVTSWLPLYIYHMFSMVSPLKTTCYCSCK